MGWPRPRPEDIQLDKYYIDVNGQPFYRLRVDGSSDGMGYNELLYATIINGYSLKFRYLRRFGDRDPGAGGYDAFHRGSITFSEILEKPETTATAQDYIVVVSVLLFAGAGDLGAGGVLPHPEQEGEKAEGQAGRTPDPVPQGARSAETILGELRFANSTECTKEAIHTFSIYQSYVKTWALC